LTYARIGHGRRTYSSAVRFAFSWLSNVVAIWVAALVFDGITYGDRFWVLLLAGLVFGIVNLIVRPIVVLLALPAVILTLGIALLFVNALMLYLTDLIVPDFEVRGFWTAVGGALIVWLVNLVIHGVLRPAEEQPLVRVWRW
jgi:putative membrane protein